MKQKSICAIVSALFFTIAAPAILPLNNLFAIFPHISELYRNLESLADGMIPDGVKQLISILNRKLS